MNGNHFTVYLAGPISGCNRIQRRQWREEIKTLLGKEFAFHDPAEWEDNWDPSREMLSIDACDAVVANMWKESVGTTIGIMHARMDGKPVVLVDPNHLQSPILAGLVHPEQPVQTLPEAAGRIRAIQSALRPVQVQKSDGRFEPFSREKLVRSLRAACVAAGADDTILPLQLFGRVNERLRLPGDARPMATGEIKRAVGEVLGSVSASPVYPAEIREAARRIRRAWEAREAYKNVDQLYDEAVAGQMRAEARARELEQDVQRLEGLVERLARRRGPAGADPGPAAAPKVGTVAEAVREARERFEEQLSIQESALKSAEKSPFRHPEKAFRALEVLAGCARDRQEAARAGERVPGMREWFSAHQELLPGLEYKNGESRTTLSHWGEERTFVVDGQPVLMDMHLALGDGGPEAALRIHFAVEPDTFRMLVGHVGRHLTNTRT